MIIDTHAHALDEAFLADLCRAPRFGLSADRDQVGRFCVRRGDESPVSLDHELRGAEADAYFRANLTKPPADYLRQLYFDTCSQSAEAVDFTIRVAGPDRVMFGTDYPFEIGDAEGRRALPALQTLAPEIRQKILHDNAATVLAAASRAS